MFYSKNKKIPNALFFPAATVNILKRETIVFFKKTSFKQLNN